MCHQVFSLREASTWTSWARWVDNPRQALYQGSWTCVLPNHRLEGLVGLVSRAIHLSRHEGCCLDVQTLATITPSLSNTQRLANNPAPRSGAGCRARGSGFGVQDSGFRVQGAGCRVQGAGCRVQVAGFRVQGSGIRVQGSGFKVRGPRCLVQGAGPVAGFRCWGVRGSGSRVQGAGSHFWVQGSESRVEG